MDDRVLPAFYAYVFLSRHFNESVLRQIKGAQLPRVGWQSFASIEIPLPPLEVQREIVAEIEGYQKDIDGARRLIERAEGDIKATITRVWNKEGNKKGFSIPSDLDHIKMIAMLGENNRRMSGSKLGDYEEDLNVLGISLSILYQVGTCHRKCSGGPHVLESLAGRTYNLACSAYTLICRGLYDEALSLIRSMGEISNLMALFVEDKEAFELWLHSDKETHWKKFSPARVRESLRTHESNLMLADQDWHSKFCEDYTHVHPGTRPNVHNEQGLAHAGGFVQEEGLKFSIDELTNFCILIALFASKYTDVDDLFKELCEALPETQAEQDENGRP